MFEDDFRRISQQLYDTSVRTPELERDVLPYLDAHVVFVDPWQTGSGVKNYRLGMAGFHSMFRFTFDFHQVNVQMAADGKRGRAIVDGVMQLRQVAWLYTYPLRTILTFEFERTEKGAPAPFRITRHEEMWSLGDMIEGVPGVGWAYAKLFRPGFARAFLAASYVSAKLKGNLPGTP